MSSHAKPYHLIRTDRLPSKSGIIKDLAGSVFVALIILAGFCSLVGGCAITPQIVTTEVVKTADGFTIKSPKDVDAAFFQAGPVIYARYKSSGNAEAIKAGSQEAAQRAAAVAKLAEAAASLR